MTENDYVFVFVCKRSRGMDVFNWIFKFFIIEIDCFFNIMRRGKARLENLIFIKREQG
jgi:hypothetical protein